ncbi:MAG: alpha-glucosidase, partial [bacterium]
WLPAIEVDGGAVVAQEDDEDSVLALYRDLVALRPKLGSGLRFLDATEGVLAYRRGDEHVVALNLADGPRPAPSAGAIVRATHAARHPAGGAAPAHLEPGEGFVARA